VDPDSLDPNPNPEKPSALKGEHLALQRKKFTNFSLFLWDIFALLDPDPGTPLNPDPIRIRIHNTFLLQY
jgi:hypothetical protein